MRTFLNRLAPYIVLFYGAQFILRASLMARAMADAAVPLGQIAKVFVSGLWFDTVALSFGLLPLVIAYALFPATWFRSNAGKRAGAFYRFLFCYVLLFDAIAEHLFWSEFNSRFNFIAVDYLVYTQEVVGNIVESYPLFWILAAIGLCAGLLTWGSYRFIRVGSESLAQKPSWASLAAVPALCGCLYFASAIEQSQVSDNIEANQVATNGMYALFYAFWNNEIEYDRFYATEPREEVEQQAHKLLDDEYLRYSSRNPHDLTRVVTGKGNEQHKNVVMVVMESMSASYMGVFGNEQKLTPQLDALSKQGLFFSNAYATGTRTVRGLEALTLSIPPTPGQSILRRMGNNDLFSLGFVFKDRGYTTQFIYGGYGYFDNMNAFFSTNGFDIIDRAKMASGETHFANVWGICDEDMFARAIHEGDLAFEQGKPFFQVIMTTSNHRPYTYPEGRIDIPSKSNRYGGVKYADYSVGKLIEWAKEKPWFNDTVFIFVSDHTAGAGGKAELDPTKYHIPIIFYSPSMIQPKRFDHIASQIDVAPVLLGMLNFSYYTKFYGEDLLADKDEIPHAFISNFQKVALIKEDTLTVLEPKRKVEQYEWPQEIALSSKRSALVEDTIAYYQSASWWKETYHRIPTVVQVQ